MFSFSLPAPERQAHGQIQAEPLSGSSLRDVVKRSRSGRGWNQESKSFYLPMDHPMPLRAAQ